MMDHIVSGLRCAELPYSWRRCTSCVFRSATHRPADDAATRRRRGRRRDRESRSKSGHVGDVGDLSARQANACIRRKAKVPFGFSDRSFGSTRSQAGLTRAFCAKWSAHLRRRLTPRQACLAFIKASRRAYARHGRPHRPVQRVYPRRAICSLRCLREWRRCALTAFSVGIGCRADWARRSAP